MQLPCECLGTADNARLGRHWHQDERHSQLWLGEDAQVNLTVAFKLINVCAGKRSNFLL